MIDHSQIPDGLTTPFVLEASEVTFGYNKSSPVLRDLSIGFIPGSMTAICGTSGKGKSTLLYLLGLMLLPLGGKILFNGIDTSEMDDAGLATIRAHHYGFIFQDSVLDATRSVLDNVTETALYRGERRDEMEEKALAYLDRFQVMVPPNRKPNQISGGQAQRIGLCRALINDPAVVLADEPTGNLDSETSTLVTEVLREKATNGSAVIIVTHSFDVAQACDRIVML